MSGTINDMALRICRCCRKPWMEDDRMYFDPNRCPHCGADATDCNPATGPEVYPDPFGP